jgi:hypothetical protein
MIECRKPAVSSEDDDDHAVDSFAWTDRDDTFRRFGFDPLDPWYDLQEQVVHLRCRDHLIAVARSAPFLTVFDISLPR